MKNERNVSRYYVIEKFKSSLKILLEGFFTDRGTRPHFSQSGPNLQNFLLRKWNFGVITLVIVWHYPSFLYILCSRYFIGIESGRKRKVEITEGFGCRWQRSAAIQQWKMSTDVAQTSNNWFSGSTLFQPLQNVFYDKIFDQEISSR